MRGQSKQGVIFRPFLSALPSLALPLLAAWLAIAAGAHAERAAPRRHPALLDPPTGDDYTADALYAYQQRLVRTYGHYSTIPLDVKAEHYEWQLWRYHLSELQQATNRVQLPKQVGQRPVPILGSDTSTWNGALLAALSYKYAATGDKETLVRIAELVKGLHLFFHATGVPGLPARAIYPAEQPPPGVPEALPFTLPGGRRCYYTPDAAKGGMNQLAIGYAALMMHAHRDLPSDAALLAAQDASDLAYHLAAHDYRMTNHNGERTSHGDLTPMVGRTRIPFNAQVAYLVIAVGNYHGSTDPQRRAAVAAAFAHLRDEHVFYEKPLHGLVYPQRVAASPFVKGMNDRNHVLNCAFTGIMLELDWNRRHNRPFDVEFTHQLGQTMVLGMQFIDGQRNALCNFMWAALVQERPIAEAMLPGRTDAAYLLAARNLVDGVEQLRRFHIDRFLYHGSRVDTGQVQWVDACPPDDFHWKCDPTDAFVSQPGRLDTPYCAIDYLYAYWLMRCFELDKQPVLAPYAPLLQRTAGLTTQPVD